MTSARQSSDRSLTNACRHLVRMYEVCDWWPAHSRFEIMIGAVLVQNTRWNNVVAAVRALRGSRCANPAAISAIPADELAAIIRPAGCQSVKARRLRAMARWVCDAGGLRTLSRLATSTLRGGLLSVHGIGPETADAILCFGFARRQFVADAYARRWLDRMGFADAPAVKTYEACRAYVETGLRRSRIHLGELHAAIVLHAQTSCTVRPGCERCRLRRDCLYGIRRGTGAGYCASIL